MEIPEINIGKIEIPKIDMRSEKDRTDELKNIPDLTKECENEIGEQLQKIKEYEQKFKDRWKFEGESGYFFSICFKSKEERDLFLSRNHVKLLFDDHCFYEDIKHIFKGE